MISDRLTEAQPRTSAEFVESSVLEVVVPSDAALDIGKELKAWDGNVEEDTPSILPFVSQRQLLLFGKNHDMAVNCARYLTYA
jgi:hypothetical protein